MKKIYILGLYLLWLAILLVTNRGGFSFGQLFVISLISYLILITFGSLSKFYYKRLLHYKKLNQPNQFLITLVIFIILISLLLVNFVVVEGMILDYSCKTKNLDTCDTSFLCTSTTSKINSCKGFMCPEPASIKSVSCFPFYQGLDFFVKNFN